MAAVAAPKVGDKRQRPATDEENGDGGDRETGRRVVPRQDPQTKDEEEEATQVSGEDAEAGRLALELAARQLNELPPLAHEARMYIAVNAALRGLFLPLSGWSLDVVRYIKAACPTAKLPKRCKTIKDCVAHVLLAICSAGRRRDARTWGHGEAMCLVTALLKFGEQTVFDALCTGERSEHDDGDEDDYGDEEDGVLTTLVRNMPLVAAHFLNRPGIAERLRSIDCNTRPLTDTTQRGILQHLFQVALYEHSNEMSSTRPQMAAMSALNAMDDGGHGLNSGPDHPLLSVFFEVGPQNMFEDILREFVALDGTRMRLIGETVRFGDMSVRLEQFEITRDNPPKKRKSTEERWNEYTARRLITNKIREIRAWCRELHRVVVAAFEGNERNSEEAVAKTRPRVGLSKDMWSVVALYALHPTLHATAVGTEPEPAPEPEPVHYAAAAAGAAGRASPDSNGGSDADGSGGDEDEDEDGDQD